MTRDGKLLKPTSVTNDTVAGVAAKMMEFHDAAGKGADLGRGQRLVPGQGGHHRDPTASSRSCSR